VCLRDYTKNNKYTEVQNQIKTIQFFINVNKLKQYLFLKLIIITNHCKLILYLYFFIKYGDKYIMCRYN